MKNKILGLVAVGLLAVVSSRTSATIVYTATTDRPIEFRGGTDTDFFLPTGSLPTLTGDFGADKTLQITYSAPAGMRFQFTPPANSALTLLAVDLSTTIFVPPIETSGGSFSFSGVVGTPPTLAANGFWYSSADPIQMRAFTTWFMTEPFGFESITIEIPVPAAFTTIFEDFVPGFAGLAAILFDGSAEARFFNLVPISYLAEPGTLALLGLGLLGLGLTRRRAN